MALLHGGAALAIDYGEEGPLGDTLQAIKDHEFCHILDSPGTADLSAYVDFGAMRQVIADREDTGGGGGGGVGPGRRRPPRHPTHFELSCRELNGL